MTGWKLQDSGHDDLLLPDKIGFFVKIDGCHGLFPVGVGCGSKVLRIKFIMTP